MSILSNLSIEFLAITVFDQTHWYVSRCATAANLEAFSDKLRLRPDPPIFIIIKPCSKKSLSHLFGYGTNVKTLSQLDNILKCISLSDSIEREIIELSIGEHIDTKKHAKVHRKEYQFEQKYFRAIMKYPQYISCYYRFVYFFNKNTKTFDNKLFITTLRAPSSKGLPLYGVAVRMSGREIVSDVDNKKKQKFPHLWKFDKILRGNKELIEFIQKKYADKCGNEELVKFKLNDTIISNLVPLSLGINREVQFKGGLVLDKNSLKRVCSSEQMFGEKNDSMRKKAQHYRKYMKLMGVNKVEFILLTKNAIYDAFSRVQTRPDILLTQMYNDKKVKGNNNKNEVGYEFQMPVEIIYNNVLCKVVAVVKPRQYDNKCKYQVQTILTPHMALENLALNYPKLHKLRLILSWHSGSFMDGDNKHVVGYKLRFLWAIMMFNHGFSFYKFISNNDYNSNDFIINESVNNDTNINDNNNNSNSNNVDEKESKCATATSPQTTSNVIKNGGTSDTVSNPTNKNVVIVNSGSSINETDEKQMKSPVVTQNEQDIQDIQDTKAPEVSRIPVRKMMETVKSRLDAAEKSFNNKHYTIFEYLESVITILCNGANENVEQDFQFKYFSTKCKAVDYTVSFVTYEILKGKHEVNKKLKLSSLFNVFKQFCADTLRKYGGKGNVKNIKEYLSEFYKIKRHCDDVEGVKNEMINVLNKWKEMNEGKERVVQKKNKSKENN